MEGGSWGQPAVSIEQFHESMLLTTGPLEQMHASVG